MNTLHVLLVSSLLLQRAVQINAAEGTAKFAVCAKLFSPYNLYLEEMRKSGALLISSDGVVRCTFLVNASEWQRVETRRQAAEVARRKGVRGISYTHTLGALCMTWYLHPFLGLPLTSTLAVLSLWYCSCGAESYRNEREKWLKRNLYGNFTPLDRDICKIFGLPQQEGRVWIYDPNFEFPALPDNLQRYHPAKQCKSLSDVVVFRGHFNVAEKYVRQLKKQIKV